MVCGQEFLCLSFWGCRSLLCPHLQNIYDLPNVTAWWFYQIITCLLVNFDVFSLSHSLDKLRHMVALGPLELQVIAMVDKWSQLLWLTIVADANDRGPAIFDNFNESGDTTTIAGAHSIDLVHDNDTFLGGYPSHCCCQSILIVFSFFNSRHTEIVKRLIHAEIFDGIFNGSLITNIASILLNHFKAELSADDSCGRCFPNARWTAQKSRFCIQICRISPAHSSSDRNLLLVSSNANVVPVLKPLI